MELYTKPKRIRREISGIFGVIILQDVDKTVKVHCPRCRNQRLFDLQGTARGTIRIKCPVCKHEVEVHLEKCDEKRQARMNAYFRSRIE